MNLGLMAQIVSQLGNAYAQSQPQSKGAALGATAATLASQAINNRNTNIPLGSVGSLPAGSQPTGGQSGSFWRNPNVQGALVTGALSAVGNGLSQASANRQTDKAMAQTQAQWEEEQALREQEFAQRQKEFDLQQLFNRDKAGLESTQLNPLSQQEARQRNAIRAALVGNFRPYVGPNSSNNFTAQGGSMPANGFGADVQAFFTPEARANAEGQFAEAAAPFVKPTDLSRVGYGNAGVAPTTAAKSYYESELAKRRASQSALAGAIDPTKSTLGTANRPLFSRALNTASRLTGR